MDDTVTSILAKASALVDVSPLNAERALVDHTKYAEMYEASIKRPDEFWSEQANQVLSWDVPFHKAFHGDYKDADITWFAGGKLNACYQCVDRHAYATPEKIALIHEGDEAGATKTMTYRELMKAVCQLANVMKGLGVRKGDVVAIYMPMVLEAVVAMLATVRLGAVHSVVFAGFSPEALRSRVEDSQAKLVLTADVSVRGGRTIPLKSVVDEALLGCDYVRHVLVLRDSTDRIPWHPTRDINMREAMAKQRPYCTYELMDAEDALFILYTSGSTGVPKGLQHSTAGYLLYAALTFKYVFDYRDGDIHACVADVGWITGHSYIVYGPLVMGATSLVFQSTPTYPNASRYWDLVQRHKLTSFYTAPTAIRLLMKSGEKPFEGYDLSSLRVLGTVGEPISPEAWTWFHRHAGRSQCAVVDTYWQTETGGHVITTLPGAHRMKPGSAGLPFFGIEIDVLDSTTGAQQQPDEDGNRKGVLVMKSAWPGIARTVFGDHPRYKTTYFAQYPGNYFPADGCIVDRDGYVWITGRVDDVINKCGHRLGTAEIEGALAMNPAVAEAAVVAKPDEIKGQAIVAFVSLKANYSDTDKDIVGSLKNEVRKHIGGLAVPDVLILTHGLPKTRSGKIMRRLLRKIAEGNVSSLGDVSTLADPDVITELTNKMAKASG